MLNQFFFSFETESHTSQTGIELTILQRTSIFVSSCFYLQTAKTTGV